MRENLPTPEGYYATSYERFLDFLEEETESYKAPQWEEFIAIYPREKREKDENRWEKKRKDPERREPSDEEMLRADMATRLVLYAVGNLGVLDPPKSREWEAYSGRSHTFDDEFNGTDMVIVFRNEETGEETPLAVDVTTTSDEGVVEEKHNRIIKGFKRGRLTELEYYKSPVKGAAIGKAEMPTIILQYKRKQLEKLASAWLERGGNWAALSSLKGEIETELKEEICKQLKQQLQVISSPNLFLSPETREKMKNKIKNALELLT